MTYKHYLAMNRLHDQSFQDSRDSYRRYLELFSPLYRLMPVNMKEQFLTKTYNERFSIQYD